MGKSIIGQNFFKDNDDRNIAQNVGSRFNETKAYRTALKAKSNLNKIKKNI